MMNEGNFNETLVAKLRNQLSPMYNLVDMILLQEENPEQYAELKKKLILETAKIAQQNKVNINKLLEQIENEKSI